MKPFEVAYIPIGVGTFHLESAQKEFQKSSELLKSMEENTIVPEEMLNTIDSHKSFLDTISPSLIVPAEMLLSIDGLKTFLDKINPDLIVLQNLTFANAAYTSEILKKFTCPILLWTLREPVIDGGRLRLNSLTGAFSAANTIRQFREEPFEYIFGSPDEEKVQKKIRAVIKAARIKKELQSAKLSAIGHTPQGFGFGRAMDAEMQKNFGVTLESIEARELIDKAKAFTDEEIEPFLSDAEKRMKGLQNTPEKNRMDFARLYKAYKEYVEQNNISAIASRCWPDFFTAFGTPVCTVLAILNDLGIAASCEADTYGALSMLIAMKLSDNPVFFGDPVSMDEEENTITFWHCGTAACSLARNDTGAEVGVHCNRKIGPTLDFGCRSSDEATIFRIGKNAEGNFRFFIASGEIADKPKQFTGTSLVVKTKNNAEQIISTAIKDGWEPHYVIAFKDISDELEILCNMLNKCCCKF